MKFKRIIAMPFVLAADVITLGKMGEGSFTQDMFNAEKREQQIEAECKAIKTIAELVKAIKG